MRFQPTLCPSARTPRRVALPTLLLTLLTVGILPANAQNLTSVYDIATPTLDVTTGANERVVGWVTHPNAVTHLDALWLMTTKTWYESPLYNGSNLSLTPSSFEWESFAVTIRPDSVVASDLSHPDRVLLTGGEGFVGSGVLYSQTSGSPVPSFTNVPVPGSGGRPSGMVTDATGAVYLSRTTGIGKYPDYTLGTPSLSFDADSVGVNALTFGPDGLLYGLNPTAGKVLSFNPGTGSLVSSFNLSETAMSSALAIDNLGRLFTANGNGGGSIYNIFTGNHIGTLSSSSGSPNYTISKASLLLDGIGNLYLFDNQTGIHVFDVAAPEPGSLALLGMAALPIVGIVRRRSKR